MVAKPTARLPRILPTRLQILIPKNCCSARAQMIDLFCNWLKRLCSEFTKASTALARIVEKTCNQRDWKLCRGQDTASFDRICRSVGFLTTAKRNNSFLNLSSFGQALN